MKCSECPNNYLYAVYHECMNKYERTNDALIAFDKICNKSGDPRSPLTIVQSMYENTCDECAKYRIFYEKYLR